MSDWGQGFLGFVILGLAVFLLVLTLVGGLWK